MENSIDRLLYLLGFLISKGIISLQLIEIYAAIDKPMYSYEGTKTV